MKKMKLNLTVLMAFILTACSSGGSRHHSNINHSSPSKKNEAPVVSANNNIPNSQAKKEQAENTELGQNNPAHQPLDKPIIGEAVQPIQPMNQAMGDQAVFNRLSSYPKELHDNRVARIELNGRDIALMPVRENISINGSRIHTLRDNQGNLFGYYGAATMSESVQSWRHPDEKDVKYYYLPLLDFDRSNQSVQPSQNMRYDGKMYYAYVEAPVQSLEATVVAHYNRTNKGLSMEIYNRNGMDLELREGKYSNRRYVVLSGDQQNNVFGALYDKNTRAVVGQFDGGIYGASGEILVGKTQSNNIGASTQGREDWIGVVGAKGKPN